MFIPLLLSGLFLSTPVKDTVWWNTTGGKVVEHKDDRGAACSLLLYDDNGGVSFEWDDANRIVVTATNWNWQLPDNWTVPVAMRFGDVWLSNRGNSAVIEATSHGNAVVFTTDRPIEDLLRPAEAVFVKTGDGEMAIQVRREKIGALLSRAEQCRHAIGQL